MVNEAPVTICAWCVKAGEVQQVPGASHGICMRHAEQVREEVRLRRERQIRCEPPSMHVFLNGGRQACVCGAKRDL